MNRANLEEHVEHLTYMLREMTALPEPVLPDAQKLWHAGLDRSEERILAMLVKNEGRVVTRDALLSALTWDRYGKDEPDIKIIHVHVYNIRKKLRATGSTGRIDNVHGVGYVWRS